jgi:hypothetical protein
LDNITVADLDPHHFKKPDPDPHTKGERPNRDLHHSETAFFPFFDQTLKFTYLQAVGEASSPQKRTPSISKNEIY